MPNQNFTVGNDPMYGGAFTPPGPPALCANSQYGFSFILTAYQQNPSTPHVAIYMRNWTSGNGSVDLFQSWDGNMIRQWNPSTRQWDVIKTSASQWGPFTVGMQNGVPTGISFITQNEPPVGGGDSDGGNTPGSIAIVGNQMQFNSIGGGSGQITVIVEVPVPLP